MRFEVRSAAFGAVLALGLAAASLTAGVARADVLVTIHSTLTGNGYYAPVDGMGAFGPVGASLDGAAVTLTMRVPDPPYAGAITSYDIPNQAFQIGGANAVLPIAVTVNGITVTCATYNVCDPNPADQSSYIFTQADRKLGDVVSGAVGGEGEFVTGGINTFEFLDFDIDFGATADQGFGETDPLDLSTFKGLTWTPPAGDLKASLGGDIFIGFTEFQDYLSNPIRTVQTALVFEGGTISFEAVPEPAAWALMIAGFGLTGAALRRRRTIPA